MKDLATSQQGESARMPTCAIWRDTPLGSCMKNRCWRDAPSGFAVAAIAAVLALAASSMVVARSLYVAVTTIYSAEHMRVQHDAGEYTVRLFGIDVPDDGALASAAQDLVVQMVAGQSVRVNIIGRNAQDEMVAMMLVNGEDVALALARAGLARRLPDAHYKPHAHAAPDRLVAAEDEARLAERGVWRQVPKLSA